MPLVKICLSSLWPFSSQLLVVASAREKSSLFFHMQPGQKHHPPAQDQIGQTVPQSDLLGPENTLLFFVALSASKVNIRVKDQFSRDRFLPAVDIYLKFSTLQFQHPRMSHL